MGEQVEVDAPAGKDRTLTLLTATKRPEISEAVVLADLLGA